MEGNNKNKKFFRNPFIKNKKGVAIGTTLTWVLATIIIVAVLIIFVYISFLMSKVKAIHVNDVRSDLNEDSEVLSTKTSIAEQIDTSINKNAINEILEEKNG